MAFLATRILTVKYGLPLRLLMVDVSPWRASFQPRAIGSHELAVPSKESFAWYRLTA